MESGAGLHVQLATGEETNGELVASRERAEGEGRGKKRDLRRSGARDRRRRGA